MEVLTEFAGPVFAQSAKSTTSETPAFDGIGFDMESYLTKYGWKFRQKSWSAHPGGFLFVLAACPFNAEHTQGSAACTLVGGTPGFHCQHAGCEGKTVRELFQQFPPEREGAQRSKQPPGTSNGKGAPQPNGTATAEEPEVAESPLFFPEDAWRGVFADYKKAMQSTTEASDVAHFATLWAAAAAALERRVWMYSGDFVYPNIYLGFFVGTGDKKTTAQRRIITCNLLQEFPDIKIIRKIGSTEGLADELGDASTYLFLWEEFASLLVHARWSNATLFEFITETFDCPPQWGKAYRKKPIHLINPTPTILTAMTPEWFWKYAQAADFFGGFGNRFLYLTGDPKAPLSDPEPVDDEFMTPVKAGLRALAEIPAQCAAWNKEAKAVWREFYLEWGRNKHAGLLGAALRRLHVYIRKLSLVYAAFEGTLPQITAEQLKAAIAVGKYAVQSTEILLDLQTAFSKPQGELEQRFLKWITAHQGARVRILQQRMWKHCGDSETFNRVLRSLEWSDQIEVKNRQVFFTT